MDTLDLVRSLAIIIIAAKFFGLVARKLHAPQVAGEIVAGLLIGPSVLNWVEDSAMIDGMAEIGVLLLLFSAGLGTNIKDLQRTGVKATLIACAGVFVPMAMGALLYMCFYGFSGPGTMEFYKALFIGTILAATSVSITVQALQELGKLKGLVGTTIMGAAIIDDVIGILVLTFVIGLVPKKGVAADAANSASIGSVAIRTALFFAFAIGVGFIIYRIFAKIDKRWPHTRRIPIMGLALCFSMAYIAERFFGVADITGAYVAGVILCSLDDSEYIARKMDINSYMLFGPIFFASIGLQTNVRGMDLTILWFSLAFVAVGMIGKIIGCGVIGKACGFTNPDCLKIGCGMMTRGEVALIVAQRGLKLGLMTSQYFTAVILLIIISSIVTPIILKVLYEKEDESDYTDFRHPVRAAAGAKASAAK